MLKRLISVILVLSLVLAGMSVAFADSLRIGSRGDEVTKLQKALQKLGLYSMKVDGVYGQGTFAAVQAFQKKYGLKADGIAGAKTLAKLYGSAETSSAPAAEAGEGKKDTEEGKEETAAPAASGTMRQGDRGENVKQLQAKLKELGLYSLKTDGVYGRGTALPHLLPRLRWLLIRRLPPQRQCPRNQTRRTLSTRCWRGSPRTAGLPVARWCCQRTGRFS